MNDMIPPSGGANTSEAQAAEAERRAPPIPVSASGPDPSIPLRGPNAPAPYQPYSPYPPASPSYQGSREGGGGRERQPVARWVVAIGSVLLLLAILMAAGFLFVGIMQGMAWAAGPVRATDTRTFSASGTPTLILDASAGNVHVLPGANGQVAVTLTKEVQAITHAAAEQALAAISIDATQSGDTLRVSVREPSFDGVPQWTSRKVDLTVSVPASANLDLTLSAGNLDVTGISGTLLGRVSAGNLTLVGVTVSGTSSLHVSAGNVEYRGALAPGASLDVSVTAGNVAIFLPRTTLTHVQASVTGGNASVTGWSNVSTARAGNGSIAADLNPQPTSTLSIQVTAGNVSVRPGT